MEGIMEETKTTLQMIKMSDVQPQEMAWLWYPFIPYGKLTIIQGDPGDGKTTLVLNIVARLSKGEGLVSVMMANNEIGSIRPIKELARITHERNALFHTDAVRTTGHIFIGVKELDVDMISASAHKFNGPKGIGFLYVKKRIKLKPYMDGGAQEHSLRTGIENVAAIVGMTVALRKNVDRMSEYRKK